MEGGRAGICKDLRTMAADETAPQGTQQAVQFKVDPVVLELGARFADAGFELSLVGGPVRDLFLGRTSPDLDFTTDATPDETIAVIRGWADAHWDIEPQFGTIGLRRGPHQIEVTTYRAEAYDPWSPSAGTLWTTSSGATSA